ncbi:unnamed protein product [Meloidogyne enterolobii]|uniref:Uncharacterized protein n=1 Tax=Meloidogyne enterolobii TaxID=390850 RepID=A0ACB0ZJV6_MELEN
MNILLLPVEVHLDIFKYLNFNQISSIQQTNSYFCSLIDKYIGILAKKKFYSFETIVYKSVNDKNKYLKLNEEDIGLAGGFELSKELEGKWQHAIDNKTSMYYFSESLKSKEPYIINFAICVTVKKPKRKDDTSSKRLLLKLPYIPKNIKEMLLWRSWLVRLLLNCSYVKYEAKFANIIFNPIMIVLLFKNTNPLISLTLKHCENGVCAEGGQFCTQFWPNFLEDMEKENASQNLPWLPYAKVATLSCLMCVMQENGSNSGVQNLFFFVYLNLWI